MAAATQASHSSRFAGVKTFSEKFKQPELDEQGRVRKWALCGDSKARDFSNSELFVTNMTSNADFPHQDGYHQTLKVFLKLTEQRKVNLACLRQEIPTALQKLQLGKDKSRFNVLSVGAGDGFMDLEILNIVEEGYLNKNTQFQTVEILNTGVEPMNSYAKRYNEFFENRAKLDASSPKRSVNFEFKSMTFEQYVNTEHDENQYDLIQAIHSLYYVDSLESTLNHCYHSELGDKGLIVCMLLAQGCTVNQIKAAINKNRDADDKEEFLRTTEDVVSLAKANKWEFTHVNCSWTYDMTQILKETTEEGKMLLDFLTFKNHFLDTGDKESIANVCTLLKDMATEDDEGRLKVKEVNDLVIIYKG